LEFFVAERGCAGAGGGGAVGWGGFAGGWAGVAGSLAAASAGFFWVMVLGLELCGGYGGVAGGAVPVARWADCSGGSESQ